MPITERTVVSTGTMTDPYDLGYGMTYSVTAGTQDGGAVYVESTGVASGENLTFSGNGVTTEAGKGGAIYNAGWLLLYGDTVFSSNSVYDGASGAVYNAGTGKLVVSDTVTLSTDTDTVYNEGSLIWNFTDDKVAKVVNYEYVTNATTEEGIPAGILGIWVDAAESLGSYVIATGDLSDYATNPAKYAFSISTDGETFAGLTLSNKVYFNNRCYTLALNEGKTELTLTVENGTAPGQRLTVEDGEWITVQEDTVYDFTSQVYYAGNGGIIEVQSGGTFTNRPDTVLQFINGKSSGSDKSVSVGGESYKSAGGAIYSAGVVNLKSATFTNNRASGYHSGGAVYSTNELTLSNANFTGNASERDGGAICVSGGTANVTGSTFDNNTASYSGGAIRLQAGTLNMSDVTFTNNKATSVVGGAISFRTGTAVIDKATFTGNTSKDSGGAVFNSASNITIKNSKFKGNQSAKGGAIVNGYMSEGNAVLYLDNVTFGGDSAGDNNTATSGNGNAIYNIAGNTIHLLGDVYLMTSNETIYLESCSKLDWVISDTDGTLGYVNDYFLISGTTTKDTLTIDAEDALESEYTLAGDASSADGQEFTITTADGTSQTITVGGSTVTDDTYGTQYKLAVNTDYELVLSVEKADVTLAVFSQEKTYDGTTDLVDTEGYLFTGFAAGFTGSATLTNDKSDAGDYTGAIDATDITIKNGQDDVTKYYNVTTNKGNLTINKREVTVTGTTADEKMYDGNTDATVHLGTVDNTIEGDDVTVTAAGEFDNKNAGNGKTVTIMYTLSGDDAGNYTVDSGDTIADITKRDVTITSDSATKTFDSTPLTCDTVTISGSGWADGEGATYDITGSQTEVGTSKNTFSYTLNDNTKAGNYTISTAEGDLTVTGAPVCNYNSTPLSDIVQVQDGLVHVMHDTDSGYVQSAALNDIDTWTVTEFRRDLTGDALADIQITKDAGDGTTWVAALRNDYLTDGTITLNYQFIGAYNNKLWEYLGSADTNGDGAAEILMEQTKLGADHGIRHVAAWVTDGEGKWIDNEWVGGLSGDWSDVAGTADIDGNGTDNVILRRADGMIGYWNEAGTGEVTKIGMAEESVLVTSGDFDGDKTDDLLFTNADGDFFTWSNISGELSNVKIGNISDLGGSWGFAGAGDYNGDGKDEILWCNGTDTAYGEANKDNFSKLVQIA